MSAWFYDQSPTITEMEVRALNAVDDIRQATGLDMFITYSPGRRCWLAGLNNGYAPVLDFETVDEAVSWAYWYAESAA